MTFWLILGLLTLIALLIWYAQRVTRRDRQTPGRCIECGAIAGRTHRQSCKYAWYGR